jgi:hypothetical protein
MVASGAMALTVFADLPSLPLGGAQLLQSSRSRLGRSLFLQLWARRCSSPRGRRGVPVSWDRGAPGLLPRPRRTTLLELSLPPALRAADHGVRPAAERLAANDAGSRRAGMRFAVLAAANGVVALDVFGIFTSPLGDRFGVTALAPAVQAASVPVVWPESLCRQPTATRTAPLATPHLLASVSLADCWRGVPLHPRPSSPIPPVGALERR